MKADTTVQNERIKFEKYILAWKYKSACKLAWVVQTKNTSALQGLPKTLKNLASWDSDRCNRFMKLEDGVVWSIRDKFTFGGTAVKEQVCWLSTNVLSWQERRRWTGLLGGLGHFHAHGPCEVKRRVYSSGIRHTNSSLTACLWVAYVESW